jgi:hypothetical protein
MAGNTWRLLTLPGVLLALLLVGSPDFPALERALSAAFTPAPTVAIPSPPPPETARPAAEPAHADRRGALLPLYASFAALQGLDIHSTLRAIRGGRAREGNPVMTAVADSPAAFVALKAAAAAGVIYLTEHVRTRNRVGALVLMGALNTLYAVVVASNYRAAGRDGR